MRATYVSILFYILLKAWVCLEERWAVLVIDMVYLDRDINMYIDTGVSNKNCSILLIKDKFQAQALPGR